MQSRIDGGAQLFSLPAWPRFCYLPCHRFPHMHFPLHAQKSPSRVKSLTEMSGPRPSGRAGSCAWFLFSPQTNTLAGTLFLTASNPPGFLTLFSWPRRPSVRSMSAKSASPSAFAPRTPSAGIPAPLDSSRTLQRSMLHNSYISRPTAPLTQNLLLAFLILFSLRLRARSASWIPISRPASRTPRLTLRTGLLPLSTLHIRLFRLLPVSQRRVVFFSGCASR